MEQLLKDLAPHVQNAEKTNNEIGALMDDITDPKRWKGLSSALDGVFSKAQKGVRDFSGVLSNMGMGDAANALNGVSSQISGGLENMRKMQEFSKQLGSWSDAMGKRSTSFTTTATQRTAEATSFTSRAAQAQSHASRAASMGNTASAARFTALATQYTASANAASSAATNASKMASATSHLSKGLSYAGTAIGKVAVPLALVTPALGELAFAMGVLYNASKKALAAEQARLQESSDLRILTRANTAALTASDAQRAGGTNAQEWDKSAALFSNRARLFGMEMAASEELIQLEMERLRAVNAVSSATEALSHKQAEQVKELENQFKERERAGTWEQQSSWFSSAATSGTGESQSGGKNVASNALLGAAAGAAAGAAIGAFFGGIGAVPGALVGGLVGGAGSLIASATTSRTEKDAVARHLDKGWGSGQDKQIEQSMNARNMRESKELFEATKANFEILNAPITRFAAELQSFGQYLPKDQLDAFSKTLEDASAANMRLAKSQAEVERLENIAGMSSAQLKNEYADKVTGWFGGEKIKGYSAQVGNRQIVANTEEEFNKKMAEALDAQRVALDANRIIANAAQAALQVRLQHEKETAQLEKSVHDARMRGLNASKDMWSEISENIVNVSQGYKSMASNITSARLKGESAERISELEMRMNRTSADIMKPVVDKQKEYEEALLDATTKANTEMQGRRPEFNPAVSSSAVDQSGLDGVREKTRSALEGGNQRMADIQRRHADALHSQAMQNADTEHKHSLVYMIERAKKERELNKEIYLDRFRARQIELQTSAESSQRSTDTDFAKSIFSAKSGTERMQAAAQYQFDTQYNAQKTQLEQKHAAQTEEQEKQGATEEQKARLKQQQAREMGELDQTKSFRDAIVGALGGTGSLRDVAREQGIGQKSGLMEAHERITALAAKIF